MLVRVNTINGLVVAAACLLLLGFAAEARASDCPECDQYTLQIPDPRGKDGNDSNGSSPSTGTGSSPAGTNGSAETDSSGTPASGSASEGSNTPAGEAAAEARSEKRARKRKRKAKQRALELSGGVAPETVASEDAASAADAAQQDLDYDQRPVASAALAQLANPLTIIVLIAMGGSLWFASRHREGGGS